MEQNQAALAPTAGKATGASCQDVVRTIPGNGTARRGPVVIEDVEPMHRLLAASVTIRARRTSRGRVRISAADRMEQLSSELAELRVQHLELERQVRTLEANLCAAVKALSEATCRKA